LFVHTKKHAQYTRADTLEDGGWLNCGHRLASNPTPPIKEYEMFTISTTTRRSAGNNFVIALVITLAATLAVAISQFVIASKPAVVPVTRSENAYLEYLRGEKTIYPNWAGLNVALSAYHLGEKTLYATSDAGAALTAYLLGEKALYENDDPSAALTAQRLGEKMIVTFEERESAMHQYRQGEKTLK
jgi:hypothetical protein